MRNVLLCIVAMMAVIASTTVNGAIIQYSAILSGTQEVPANPSLGSGTAAVSLDDVSLLLNWDVSWWNLSGPATGAHFHSPGIAGINAPVAIPLSTTSPAIGSTTISAAQDTALIGGEWYVNVHTALFPGGEIRGQLGVAGSSQNSPFLPGQQLPGQRGWVFNNATGTGAWFDPPSATGFLYYTDGNSNFTSITLPVAIPDNNGTYIIDDFINTPVVVAAGGTHTFASPVSTFSVTNIIPSVDPNNPVAFPMYLAFDEQTVSFTMEAIPEPATLMLGAAGLGLLMLRRKR